jgi:hypothetical protein
LKSVGVRCKVDFLTQNKTNPVENGVPSKMVPYLKEKLIITKIKMNLVYNKSIPYQVGVSTGLRPVVQLTAHGGFGVSVAAYAISGNVV